MRFTASVIRGSGRGKDLGYPTINLSLADIPPELEHGIYACFVSWKREAPAPERSSVRGTAGSGKRAVVHYGPRHVFQEGAAFEVHVLDTVMDEPPETLEIEMARKLRDVRAFASVEALKEQIGRDCEDARRILQDIR